MYIYIYNIGRFYRDFPYGVRWDRGTSNYPVKVGWKVARHKKTPNSFKNGLFFQWTVDDFFRQSFF